MRAAYLFSGLSLLACGAGFAAHLSVGSHFAHGDLLQPAWTADWLGLALGSILATIIAFAKQGRDLTRWLESNPDLTSPPQLNRLQQAVVNSLQAANQRVFAAQASQKASEIQLKIATAQRRHAEAVLFSISDAVLVTDKFDQLLMANEAAANLLGFDLKDCNRSELSKLISDKTLCQLVVDARAAGGVSGRRIVEHHRKHGREDVVLRVTLSNVTDSAGEMVGIVTVLHDMTKEREIAQMKNEFVSNVSHELRTPLASIRAYVEMLIDGEADDEKTKRNFYEVIQHEANRLGRLIDNILNISRIESGLVKINQEPQSLTVIAKEVIDVIAPQAKLKQIKINEQLTPTFYQTPADRDMIYQALLNLLSNAVKYTPENGTVTVQTEIDEKRHCVVAKISDTGVGIPPKDLPFVFDKFYRAEANNKMAKGTGLGLSLVKHIIETVHCGKLIVESVVGQGSTFGFELALSE